MNRGWKIVIVIIAVVLIGGAITFGMIWKATAPLTTEIDTFFSLLKKGKVSDAYNMTAQPFRDGTKLEDLQTFATNVPFASYESAHWNDRSISGSPAIATLKGTVNFKAAHVPATISFIKEQDVWKILNVDIQRAGLSGGAKAPVPATEASLALVKASAKDFAQSAKKKDFTPFYKNIAELWKSQTSAAELNKTFTPFFAIGEDLETIVDKASPVLDEPPSIGSNNFLTLKGYFPYQGSQFVFAFQYAYENGAWKLVAVKVETK